MIRQRKYFSLLLCIVSTEDILEYKQS